VAGRLRAGRRFARRTRQFIWCHSVTEPIFFTANSAFDFQLVLPTDWSAVGGQANTVTLMRVVGYALLRPVVFPAEGTWAANVFPWAIGVFDAEDTDIFGGNLFDPTAYGEEEVLQIGGEVMAQGIFTAGDARAAIGDGHCKISIDTRVRRKLDQSQQLILELQNLGEDVIIAGVFRALVMLP